MRLDQPQQLRRHGRVDADQVHMLGWVTVEAEEAAFRATVVHPLEVERALQREYTVRVHAVCMCEQTSASQQPSQCNTVCTQEPGYTNKYDPAGTISW